MELEVSPEDKIDHDMEYKDNSTDIKYTPCKNDQYSIIRIPEDGDKSSKHSSRKQSKRRKKNSNHSRQLPRIIVKPLPPPPPTESREWTAATSYSEPSCNTNRPSTMREVLASIPGFCIKPRKRSGKKLSTAAQLQQTREGCIDLETPDSILVNTNIRALLNKHTFSLLPPLYQYKLGQLLPSVDRLSPSGRLNSSSLNNEFFARACLQWQDSLSGGELTPENQQRMKTEAEKEKSKIDPWKLKHFEPIWGEKSRKDKSSINLNSDRPSLKTTIKLRPTASITSSSIVPKIKKSKSSSTSKRMRSVGAVTRSSAKADEILEEPVTIIAKPSPPVPDLLPLKHTKSHNTSYEECQVDFSFSDSTSAQRMDESVSTTPVDPLLLPEGETERNELKQDLNISVVTIEESYNSKDSEEYQKDEDSHFHEKTKRSSNENADYSSVAKRIKFENEYELDNTRFLVHDPDIASNTPSYSDIETNYGNEQVCPNDDVLYPRQDHGDTNSEDSKATVSVYEYDARSESSVSSLKIDGTVNSIAINELTEAAESITYDNIGTENKDNLDTENLIPKDPVKHDDQELCNYVSESYQESVKTIPENEVKCPQICEEVATKQDSYDFSPETNSETPSSIELNINVNKTPEKCEKELVPAQNITQNYYDEHFKDAESFILETSLSILTSQNDNIKYSSHPNLMELSSYMSETNVTAVVTMPLTQNSSIPMMEVTNTSTVSYPDENMKDAAKPKSSAVSWKTECDWTNNESVMNLHNFSNINNESANYVSEDTKTSMDDININDENCMYKEDRDANFNMESSNSSESCQSIKESAVKQELEITTSLVSSNNLTIPPVNSTTITQNMRPISKKMKMGKESNRSRSSNKVPPGTVNLERSYQICQAAIQNSPNRDALRGQLRPPPALLTRPARSVRPPPPPPVLVRHLPVSVMPHNEMNENRSNNVGQYILVQRTPNVAPRASSAPPANQNTNVSVARCRSVGADDPCVCNLRAMILCKKCGAFCHDDCIGSAELCLTCLIR